MRLALVTLAVVLVAFPACGQDVPTCDADCEVVLPSESTVLDPNPPSTRCASECESDLATATANGHAGDFQALLTCVGNAGSFATECEPLACGLTSAFGVPTGCSK